MKLKLFADGNCAVSYKEDNRLNKRIIERKASKQRSSQLPERWTLQKLPDGRKWQMRHSHTQETKLPIAWQLYKFVTLPNDNEGANNCLIWVDLFDNIQHCQLSDFQPAVLYAGSIIFNGEQEIAQWDNNSHGYCPPPCLAYQAGLETQLFQPVIDRNDPNNSHYFKTSDNLDADQAAAPLTRQPSCGHI